MDVPLRYQCVNAIAGKLLASREVRGVSVEVPFEYDRQDLPWAYLWEYDEEYDPRASGQLFCTLNVGVAIAYPYTDAGDFRWQGNVLAARLHEILDTDQRVGGVAYSLLPTGTVLGDLAEHRANLGVLFRSFALKYWMPLGRPFAQVDSEPKEG